MKDNKSEGAQSSYSVHRHLTWFLASRPPPPSMHIWNCRGPSQTYSLVLLGGPEREPAMEGYLETCFFRGQEAASMAPPKTSRREPPQATKMAAPNSNLQKAPRRWEVSLDGFGLDLLYSFWRLCEGRHSCLLLITSEWNKFNTFRYTSLLHVFMFK